MMNWDKVGKTVNAEGTTITYRSVESPLRIESRKRHIPHSGREGFWDHTTYVVLLGKKELATKMSLADAKEFAEVWDA